MKKILLLLITVMVIVPCLFVTVSADSASITVNTAKPDVGSTITVNLNFSSSIPLYTSTGTLNYNTSVLKYVSGGTTSSGSTVSLYKEHTGEKNTSYSIVFKTIAEGSSSLSFHVEGSDGETKSIANASKSIIVSKPTLSANANLSYLAISDGKLSPNFSSVITQYSATVRNEVSTIAISANVADGNATFDGAGSFELKDGTNTHTITVTAANGAKKSYTVTVTRLTEAQTKEIDEKTRANDPLLYSLDGVDYHVCEDLTKANIPTNFSISKVNYREKEVSVLTEPGNKYTLYCLKNDSTGKINWYTLDNNGDFARAYYIYSNKELYIIEECNDYETDIPENWYLDDYVLNSSSTVDAYICKDSDMADFCVFNCYYNKVSEFYRYDKVNGTIQRCPDFKQHEVAVNTQSSSLSPKGAVETFKSLSTMGKIIVLAILALIALSLVLLILFVIKIKTMKRFTGNYDYEDYIMDNIDDD